MGVPIWNENSKSYFVKQKDDPKDNIWVEVGDSKDPSQFHPQAKIGRWGDADGESEANVSFRLAHDFIPGTKITNDEVNGVVTWTKKAGNKEWIARFYEDWGTPEGAYKFVELVLPERPPVNEISFSVVSKDVDFFYQPPLTDEYQSGWSDEFQVNITVTETQVKDEEGNILVERPAERVGSYAVYSKTKGGLNKLGSKEYKTGKIGHLNRALIVDANGDQTWGTYNTDLQQTNQLTLSVDPTWLDNAAYPVVVDPTFGYTTAGGSGQSVAKFDMYGSKFTSPSDASTAQNIRYYAYGTYASKGILVLESTLAIVTNGIGSVASPGMGGGPPAWALSDFATDPNLSGSTDYVLMCIADGAFTLYYDSGDTNQGYYDTSNNYNSPNDPTDAANNNNKYSIYANYTASAGNVTVNPSVQTATTSQPSPTVSTGTTVSVNVQSLSTSQPGATTSIDESITTSAQSLTTSQPSPTVSGDANVTAGVQTLTSSQPAPSESTGSTISPNALALTTSQPSPSVSISESLSQPAQALTLSQPSPTISAIQNVTTSPNAQVLTTSQPSIGVSVGDGATVSSHNLTVTQPSPSLRTGVTVSAGVQSLTSSQPSPTVDAGGGGYQYYASITVDNTKVSGTANHSSFPVLVSGTYDGTGSEPDIRTTANGGNIENTDANGGASGSLTVPADLAFYDDESRTTQYDHEIQKYDASTGEFVARVRVPTLSYNSDTTFYMHYGDSSVTTSQENVGGVWEANYKAVYHLEESGDGTANEFKDSSGNAHHGQGGGGTSADVPTQATGQVAQGQSSDGSDYIEVGDHADFDISGDISFGGWWYIPNYSRYYWLMCKGDGNSAYNWAAYIKITTGEVVLGGFSPATTTSATLSTGNWHHVWITFSSGTVKIWIDGSSETFTSRSIGSTNNFPLYLMWNNYTGQKPPDGTKYDELKVYSGALSDGWVITEYNNENSPSTFYTMGSETSAGGGTNVTVNPAVQSLTSSQPTLSVSTGTTISPSAQTLSTSQPALTVSTGTTISPSVQTLATNLPSVGVSVGDGATVSSQNLTTTQPTPTLSTGVTIDANVQSLTASQPTPTITAGGNISVSPSVQTATVSQPAPTISTDVNVSAGVQTLTANQPAATTAISESISASVQTVTASLPSPTVTAIKNVTTSPNALSLTLDQPSIGISVGDRATVSSQNLSLVQPTPTITAVKNVSVSPSVQTLSASQPAPSISGDALVSPNALTATISQPAATVTTGETNTHSLDLESTSSQYAYITDTNQTGLDLSTDFSFAAWVKPESFTDIMYILNKQDAAGGIHGYYWGITTDKKFNVFYKDGSGNITNIQTTNPAVDTDAHYHIAAVVDISVPSATLYVNGSPVGDTELSTAATSINNNSEPFYLGVGDSSGLYRYFDGLLDEVVVTSDKLTQEEVQRLSDGYDASQAGIDNIQGYWQANEDYTDLSGNDNTLTAVNSPVFSTDVPFSDYKAGAFLNPSAQALTATLPAFIVGTGTTTSQSVQTLSAALPSPTVSAVAGVNISPEALALALSLPEVYIPDSWSHTPKIDDTGNWTNKSKTDDSGNWTNKSKTDDSGSWTFKTKEAL